MLSIARSAARQWMVPEVQRIHRNRSLDGRNSARGQSLSHLRQRKHRRQFPLRSRRVHRWHLPRVRRVERLAQKLKSMKTIRLALETRRQIRQRFRRRKSRTNHVCTRLLVRCANKWALCQSLPSASWFAVPMKNAWCRSSKQRTQTKKQPNGNQQGCPTMRPPRRKLPRHLSPLNGIQF